MFIAVCSYSELGAPSGAQHLVLHSFRPGRSERVFEVSVCYKHLAPLERNRVK